MEGAEEGTYSDDIESYRGLDHLVIICIEVLGW
jgi:hypothetical protein